MTNKLVTIITVNYNNMNGLLSTINSIKSQNKKIYELIIIDGLSTDGSQDLKSKFTQDVDMFICEKDEGIYDAMNKGIKYASCEWLIFLNSGDKFYSNTVLCNFQKTLKNNNHVDLFYSDTIRSDGSIFPCSKHKDRLIHQSLFYKKKLHNMVGYYISSSSFITADFFFFKLCYRYQWRKVDFIISEIDMNGISNSTRNYLQKTMIQYIFEDGNYFVFIFKLVVHPIYFRLRKLL